MHDVVIIGAGPAGLSAGLWCDELGLDTLVVEQNEEIGGQLLSVHNPIENYPGVTANNGREFLERFSARVNNAGFDLWTNVEIDKVDLKAKRIVLRSDEELQAISIIIATGVRRRQLGIPGEKEYVGHGIIESPTRDREKFAGRDVCVIGGGDAAAENALLLAEVCPTVTLVHRSKKLKARPDFISQLQSQHCITIFPEAVVTRLLGNEELEAVEIRRKDALKPFQMAVRGVAIRIGVTPNTEIFSSQLALDAEGYAVVTSQQETSVANVFAIGDVANPLAPTIIGAAGAGATAAKVIASRLSVR
ncbi:MAG: NAD(P)/FAD-dependent oxidoreductase [Acidobacteriota bacterium]|nr:NAD(P)/FAD-dependent oxidoreductase [Acidobacteriota bacterium]